MAGPKFKLDVLITAIDRITAPMRLINQNILRLTKPLTPVLNRVNALGRASGISQIADRFKDVRSAVDDVGAAGMKAIRRLTGLGVAGGGMAWLFKRQFVDTAADFESMQVSLEGIEGDSTKAAQAMQFLKAMAKDTPFEIADLGNAFRLMRVQGMDPMSGQLQAIVDYTAKLGGGSDKMLSIATQLSQATSKQKLQQQDIRVMAEQGVGVWQLLERAMIRVGKAKPGDKTIIPKLMKMSEKGLLGPKHIALLMEQMEEESKGFGKRMATGTLAGLFSGLGKRWQFFKLSVMDSGPFVRVKQIVQDILTRIDTMSANGELQQWASRVGMYLERGFTWLRDNGPAILQETVADLRTIFDVADSIAQVFGGWGTTLKLIAGVYIGGSLITAIGRLAFALTSLNLSLAGTPAGWLILAGVGAIAGAGYVANKLLRRPEEDDSGSKYVPWARQRQAPQYTVDDAPKQAPVIYFSNLPTIPAGAPPHTIDEALPRPKGGTQHLTIPKGGLGRMKVEIPKGGFARPDAAPVPEAPRPHGLTSWAPWTPPAAQVPPGVAPGAAASPEAQRARGSSPWPLPPASASLGAAGINAAAARPAPVAPGRRDKAEIKVTVAGPRGTKAEIAPASTADISLRTLVNMGPTMAGTY